MDDDKIDTASKTRKMVLKGSFRREIESILKALSAPIHIFARLPEALRDPVTQSDLLQSAKTVTAAVLAWLVSLWFGLSQPFLAPWAALLAVHATVYRTVSRGAQAVVATGVGVVLAYLAVQLLGAGAIGLGVALLGGLMLARAGLFRDEGITVATTALFVLTTWRTQQEPFLLSRIGETALGVAVGLIVNFVVIPPLNNRSAERHVDHINRRMGVFLEQLADDLESGWDEDRAREWIDHTRTMDKELDHAWQVVRHLHESSRWNPRYRSSRFGQVSGYGDVLIRLEDGIAQERSMARTIHESTISAQQWDPRFREKWLELLAATGRRIADPDAGVHHLHEEVNELTQRLSGEDLPGLWWPVYGALISNLVNVIDVVDDVASSRPVRT